MLQLATEHELDTALVDAVIDAHDPRACETEAGRLALSLAWQRLSEWLAARGDVLAEFIDIDESLNGSDFERALRRRDEMLCRWIPRWFGEYAKLDGFDRPINLAWDHGFVAAARVGTERGTLDLSRWRVNLRDLVPVLAALLAHPQSVLLQQLRVGELDPSATADLEMALRLLSSNKRPALIRLELGGAAPMRRSEPFAMIGSLHDLAHAECWAPRLAALRVVGRGLRGFPALPQLRVLELHVASGSLELGVWLLEGEWPQLERLWLRTGVTDSWGGAAEHVDTLLGRLSGSALRELGLQGETAIERLIAFAQTRPLELRELRLFGVDAASLTRLGEAAEHFAGVERLVLEEPQVEQIWSLRERFGKRLYRCDHRFGALGTPIGSHLYESLFDMPEWRA